MSVVRAPILFRSLYAMRFTSLFHSALEIDTLFPLLRTKLPTRLKYENVFFLQFPSVYVVF